MAKKEKSKPISYETIKKNKTLGEFVKHFIKEKAGEKDE